MCGGVYGGVCGGVYGGVYGGLVGGRGRVLVCGALRRGPEGKSRRVRHDWFMRIVQTATAYYPSVGGAQLHWYTIGRGLRERGHEVRALSQWTDQRNRYLLEATVLAPWGNTTYEVGGIRVDTVRPGWGTRIWMAAMVPWCLPLPEVGYPAMDRWFGRRFGERVGEVDVVHNIRIGREPISWGSWHLARRRGARFCVTPNYSPRMSTRLGRWVMRRFFRLLRRADGVVVFTEAEGAVMEGLGVSRDRICRIGVGPLLADHWDAGAFRERYGIRKNMVLFLGQKLSYKGFDTLLEAAPRVWERQPETSFVFIGPHYDDSAQRIAALGDARVVDFPRVDAMDPLKASALAAADVFALPSRQEGIGGVYIEAWAMGKPVIGCRIPFLTIEDGVDGYLVEQAAEPLAGRILELLEDPAKAAEMGARGRAKVAREYDWGAIIRRIEGFYEALRQRPPVGVGS